MTQYRSEKNIEINMPKATSVILFEKGVYNL